MGELHLEVIVDRMMREFKVACGVGKPQIAYRETITAAHGGEGKLVKQSGGKGQYGHVVLDIAPGEKGKGLTVDPVVDVHVNITDGSSHDVDSNENAFKMAAIFAMKDAFKQAGPILLEPVMDVEVVTPEEYQGDIMGDLNRRRGQIQEIENKPLHAVLKSTVPLAEMFGYSTAVRTLSSGRADYTMKPASFEQVPQNIVELLTSDYAYAS